jgi:hypothetical protein
MHKRSTFCPIVVDRFEMCKFAEFTAPLLAAACARKFSACEAFAARRTKWLFHRKHVRRTQRLGRPRRICPLLRARHAPPEFPRLSFATTQKASSKFAQIAQDWVPRTRCFSPSAPKPSLTTKGELAVPNYPLIRSLRAEELAGNYEPMHCDYPVALMTRRTFALSADRILQSRSISPSPVDSGQSLRWSSRPPC